MSFSWNNDLITGIEDVDTQHKELFARINALLTSCDKASGRDEVRGYIEYLREYIAYHFAAEEREMTTYKYPGLAAHEAEHEHFKKQVNQLYREYTEQGTSEQILRTTVWSSGEWFVNHILKTDKAMAAFLIRQAKN